MRQERRTIDSLASERYILATSRPLSPANKSELANIIGPSLRGVEDIFGLGDLEGLLRKYPEILKTHLKLWLSDAAVLDAIVHAASEAFNKITKEEIEAKVRVYVVNPSFYEANDVLSKQNVVIISGPPGVGKTTLAETLAFTYIRDGWELVAIRNLEDGFSKISDLRKQIFFFDDFLGKIALDKHALAHTDSEFSRFTRRIARSPNARFVLTTRAYIFEEARRVSEYFADERLDISKYILDVGKYTRRIKARILYNHLLVAKTPPSHFAALLKGDFLPKIVDHKHYNPRIIEFMTDFAHLTNVKSEVYPREFLNALDHPVMIWDIAFRNHISKACQHLLICLFFLNEGSAGFAELEQAYEAVHPQLSQKYGDPFSVKDFEEALKILEGGFISISQANIKFVNPSLSDYLNRYLNNVSLISELARTSSSTGWARSVWRHTAAHKFSHAQRVHIANIFEEYVPRLLATPIIGTREEGGFIYRRPVGISITDRIKMLLEWYEFSKNISFWDAIIILAKNEDDFDSWRDGAELVELVSKIRDGGYYEDFPDVDALLQLLENGTVRMIEGGLSSDDMETIANSIDENRRLLSDRVVEAMHDAIVGEIDNFRSVARDLDSVSSLEDYASTLERLGQNMGVYAKKLERIASIVEDRRFELEEETPESSSPSVGKPVELRRENFDDVALRNLFSSLLTREN